MRRITRSKITTAVAKSAALGGLTLIDPNKLTGWKKHAYWLSMAGYTASETTTADLGPLRHPGLSAGLAVGTAGLTYGAQDILARSDAWSMRVMERIGFKKPRIWAAAVAFAAQLLVSLSQPAPADEEADWVEMDEPDPEALEPLPAEESAIIEALLDAVDGYGSKELLAQLSHTVSLIDDGQVRLMVTGDAPRTLLDTYTFPAHAQFTRNGITHVLMVEIEDGQLAYLTHLVEPYPEDDAFIDWSLPDLTEVQVAAGFAETQ